MTKDTKDSGSPTRIGAYMLFAMAATLLVFSSCYWAPDSNDGDLAVTIRIPSSVTGSQDIGALDVGEDTFLYVYVLDEGLMTISPAQAALVHARIAFGDVTYAMKNAFVDSGTPTDAAAGFSMPVGLSSSRFQQLTIASSGARTFSGLPAGKEFLVGAYAVRDVDGNLSVFEYLSGFSTATVSAGQTAEVSIELGSDPIPFFDYIVTEYNLARLELDDGILGSPNSLNEPLYFDLLTSVHSNFSNGLDFTAFPISPEDFDAWYQTEAVAVVDVGRETQSKSGNRRPLRLYDGQFHVVGILPDSSWNILITEWDSRSNAVSSSSASLRKNFFSAPAGAAVELESYDNNSIQYYDDVDVFVP